MWASTLARATTMPMPAEKKASPATSIHLPPIRSANRPAAGAINMETTDIGASANPARSALSPSTDCRKMTSGRNSPSMPNAMAPLTQLISE